MQQASNVVPCGRSFYYLLQLQRRKPFVGVGPRLPTIGTLEANFFSLRTLTLLPNKHVHLKSNLSCFKCDYHGYTTIMDSPDTVFQGSSDRFNGITVESQKEFIKAEQFSKKLQSSLEHWIAEKRRTIWFKVQTEHSEWIPHLTKNGFEFHHAKAGYAILFRWLPMGETANLPVYAHTMVGVGGLVVNDADEILVISDRHALIPDSWKLPGGFVEPGENLIDAAIREITEETGVKTTFETLITIRHSHKGAFGCSDLYVVIALKPNTFELIPCEREIAKIAWMPIADYLNHPHVHETNRHFVRTFLDYRQRGIHLTCQKAVHQILKKEYSLYYLKQADDEKVTQCT